jgi:hypothetical protein
MQLSDRLAERVRKVPQDRNEISERKMFGGFAFMSLARMLSALSTTH